jgi:hypothetical protein
MVEMTQEQLEMFVSVISKLKAQPKAKAKAKTERVDAITYAKQNYEVGQAIKIKLPTLKGIQEYSAFKMKDKKTGTDEIGVITRNGNVITTRWSNKRITEQPELLQTIVVMK